MYTLHIENHINRSPGLLYKLMVFIYFIGMCFIFNFDCSILKSFKLILKSTEETCLTVRGMEPLETESRHQKFAR